MIALVVIFFFNDTATTEIYTLSLHDALPISLPGGETIVAREKIRAHGLAADQSTERSRIAAAGDDHADAGRGDRKSTRLNSSHGYISYAVFCLKKKNSRLEL